MAFLTSDRISALGVSLLIRSLVLPMTVSRVSGEEFAGDNGETVNIRVRQPGAARKQASAGAAITYDTISEVSVPVTLYNLYHATKVTDQDLTLNLYSFGEQVLEIQTSAVAIGAEDEVATAMNDLPADDTFDELVPGSDAGVAETKSVVLQAREALTAANVPPGGRFIAASASAMTRLLSMPELTRVDESGNDSALRSATIGRLFGFTIVETNAIADGSLLAYHSSAFAFATRTPTVPSGAADAAVAAESGIGLRHIRQYDTDHLSDASVVSTFAGAALVDADRVYKVDLGS